MNERIKELAVQSNLVFNPSKTTELYCSYMEDTDLTEYVEKFAELIIQDLLNKLSTEQELADQNWQCKDGVHIYYKLHQHFTTKETTE